MLKDSHLQLRELCKFVYAARQFEKFEKQLPTAFLGVGGPSNYIIALE